MEEQDNTAPAEKKPFYKTKWFNLTLGLLVTGVCFWWAFEQMLKSDDGSRKKPAEVFAEIAAAFRSADYRTLPAMWAALALFYWLKAQRWKYLLEPIGRFHPLKQLMPSTLIGFAFNNVLPAHLGEFVRVFVFSRQMGIAKTSVLTTIVLERLFDIVAILAFLMTGLFLVDTADLDPLIVTTAWIFGGFVCIALVVAAIYLVWTHPVVTFIEAILDRLPLIPPHVKEKVAGLMEAGEAGLGSLRSFRLLVGITVTSILQWLLNGFLIFLSLKAFNINVTPAVAAIVLGATAFGVTVPSSPGYFGVIQACFIAVLSVFTDANGADVFSASIYYHMSQWIPVTAIGMLFFLRGGYQMSEVQHAADSKTPAPPKHTSDDDVEALER